MLEYLWTGNNRRDPILGGFEPQVFASTDGTDLLASSPPLPPLGITCVWVVENTRWGGSPDIFGPVPTEAIRFELYETDKGLPIVPLDRVGTFIDIAPRQQAEATGGPVNVVIDAALTPGNDVMSYLLAGNSDPVTGAIDLLMAGSYDAPGGDVLDFILAIDDTRASTTMRVDDLLINSSLDVSAGLRASFNVRKRNNPRQLVEYVLVLSDAFTVSSGQVFVNEVLVANMSGDRLLPTWALATEQFVEDDNLSIMYDALLFMDSTINIQFFFSHCIGADYEAACADMVQALGL